jgi:acetoin utilization protein AcuB
MVSDPVTVSSGDLVGEAFRRMIDRGIRHLPVVDDGRLVGMVSDRDIRQTFIPPMSSGSRKEGFFLPHSTKVAEIMSGNPVTVQIGTDIEAAARVMFEHRISSLPVMKGEKLAGIVTDTDLLHLFIELLGMIKDSSRIDVSIKDDQEGLRRVLKILRDSGAHLVSVGISQVEEGGAKVYFFRLERGEAGLLAPLLKEQGFNVVKVINSL